MADQSPIEAYIAAHMAGASPARIAALRELHAGRSGGRQLRGAEEWQAALSEIMRGVEIDAAPPRPLAGSLPGSGIVGLPAADRDAEMRLVRGWMGVGSRIAGRAFLGG